MSDRPRPPRQRQPQQAEFYVDPYDYDRDSPPGSSSGGHSSADLYRSGPPIPRNNSSKALPPPPPGHAPQGSYGGQGHAPQASYGGGRSTALPSGPFGDEMGGSPRSSFSEDTQHLHLRHAPYASQPRIEGLPQQAAGYAASERESFFAPPAMPWMRNEGSQPPSRSESPSFFGAPRTSSASPMPYYPQSVSHFSHTSTYAAGKPKRQFVSHLLTGPVDKPWLVKKDRWLQAAWWVTVVLWFAGVAAAAVLCFFAYSNVPHLPNNLCLVMNEQFTSGQIDSSRWNHEVSVSGFGNGGFEWTTDSNTNSFVQNGKLYIVPTLTSEGGKYSADDILDGVNDPIDGCTNDDDSNAYYQDKVVGSAVGLQRRGLWERLVKRQDEDDPDTGTGGGNGNGNTGNGNGNTGNGNGNGNGNTGNGNGNTGNGNGNTGNGNGNTGNGNGNTGNGNGNTGNGNGNTGTGNGNGNTNGGGGGNGVTGGGVPNGGGGGSTGRTGQHEPCQVVSSRSAREAVNPVQSARLTTRGKTAIKYGRVEIRAKMPTGDWLFPQILMLPSSTVYGNWPLSGEIDLVMARGNDANYRGGGRDFITSGLQWGPGVGFNAFDRTRGWYQQRRTNFNQAFHTFTLEWNDKFMWIFVDSRVHRVINLDFKKQSFFKRGKFPLVFRNGTDDAILQNPWRDHNNAAPFDQEFYLVMTVQAGGTNGWFRDNVGKKPWFDRSQSAMFDFANATSTWHKTWPKRPQDRAMVIDSVKMWQLGKCASKAASN